MSAIVSRESALKTSASKDWLHALERSSSIVREPRRLLSTVIADLATTTPRAPALLSDRDCFTFAELSARANQYARWALKQGLEKGDVVAVVMSNQPDYFAFWLGLSSVGCIVALLNTNLFGAPLLHSLRVANPKHLIVGHGFVHAAREAQSELSPVPYIWTHGFCDHQFTRIDFEIEHHSDAPLPASEQPLITIDDTALYVFTSGTTGMPKAARVSHARILQWAQWFAGLMDLSAPDRIYSCLPMYHSIGGVLVPGAALVAGASVVIREKFSARHFWGDVIRWDCTVIQYIGEFCRYLLRAPQSAHDGAHHVRLACGNGMAGDVWQPFQSRFKVPRVLEFYASTEGGVSLFNSEGEPGSIGRIPPYLAHRFSPALIRIDESTGDPMRNSDGFCVPCSINEPGEALGQLIRDPSAVGSRFEGYTDPEATSRKVLRNVLRPDDAWVRTGDLMRRDARGYFYFVDRIGDTFRWKGENVATTEVTQAICSFPAVQHAAIYGVQVPFAEGRAGMAALVVDDNFDMGAFRDHVMDRLPSYARPLFLRISGELDVTGTFKYSKGDLVRQGYNPSATTDPIYVDDQRSRCYRRVDSSTYSTIQNDGIRS